MVTIPAGTFVMGMPPDEWNDYLDGPQTRVTLNRPFWISKFEVTQGQFTELVSENPSIFQTSGLNVPVEKVAWNDAVEFCRQLTVHHRSSGDLSDDLEYRLPTEAQWEYACRAGTTTRFSFGDDYSESGKYGWYEENSDTGDGLRTHPVGEKLPNPWGLYDMHGNFGLEWQTSRRCVDGSGGTKVG
ncbi:MAG TPA: formylglycine-generating enzyme family protein [Verrucomicrobiales bacterium]|nr:formylglycine-generating enzyme family protein [Verrucomicrobiales bacterium]HIL72324.1 formylglycine-generating enzyme family protein [Verrucomicrobiota bacterium]